MEKVSKLRSDWFVKVPPKAGSALQFCTIRALFCETYFKNLTLFSKCREITRIYVFADHCFQQKPVTFWTGFL